MSRRATEGPAEGSLRDTARCHCADAPRVQFPRPIGRALWIDGTAGVRLRRNRTIPNEFVGFGLGQPKLDEGETRAAARCTRACHRNWPREGGRWRSRRRLANASTVSSAVSNLHQTTCFRSHGIRTRRQRTGRSGSFPAARMQSTLQPIEDDLLNRAVGQTSPSQRCSIGVFLVE